jgi:hypothetical protein
MFNNPLYPTSPYYGFQSPIGGFMSGTADIINAQGQWQIQTQQAYQEREKWKQAKIETRRKNVDEYLYERAVLPTVEDERERSRIENLRRSRNDPPPGDIMSGTALNQLLVACQQQQARNVPGPSVALDANVLKNINVSSGATSGSVALLRDAGKLSWPLALRRADYKSERDQLDQLALGVYKQATAGKVDGDTLDQMTSAVSSLEGRLRQQISDISASDYIKAKRFLNEMTDTITALQDPKVSNYVTGNWAATGNTVADFVQEMTRKGLKIAPAVPGDEAAYRALHTAMVAYYTWPDKPWDTMAK